VVDRREIPLGFDSPKVFPVLVGFPERDPADAPVRKVDIIESCMVANDLQVSSANLIGSQNYLFVSVLVARLLQAARMRG
jgi:hypothetical protein